MLNPSMLRTLTAVSRSLRAPALAPLDEGSLALRIWPSDLDFNGHMNNGRYLTLMDLGRLDLLIRSGMARVVLRQRWLPLLGGVTIRFRREIEPLAEVQLHTRILCWDERWFYMQQRFVRGGRDAAIALVKGQFRHRRRHVPPASVMAAAGASSTSPPPPQAVTLWARAEAALGVVAP